MIKYRLVVNGLGKVYDGVSEEEAKRKFQLFVKQSKKRRSKSTPRLVTLFKNYEVVREYQVPERGCKEQEANDFASFMKYLFILLALSATSLYADTYQGKNGKAAHNQHGDGSSNQ